jgi:hypothetical protein
MTSQISYYIKKNPIKNYFFYDSIGNISLKIYEINDELHKYNYEYEYDNLGRIICQMELKNDMFFTKYDSVVYNTNNLPIQYVVIYPYAKIKNYINYSNEENKDIKHIYIEKQNTNDIIDWIETVFYYNSNGFLMKRIENSLIHVNWNGIEKFPSKHFEEYEYIDYKYDKCGNWIEYKCYLTWEKRGRQYHLKIKRKIEYY